MPSYQNSRSSSTSSTSSTSARGAAAGQSNAALASALNQPTLRTGSRGAAVEELQQKLLSTGYLRSRPDGIFGRDTDSALRMFQSSHGLASDGIAGRNTHMALDNPQVYRAIPVNDSGANTSQGASQHPQPSAHQASTSQQPSQGTAQQDNRTWLQKLFGGGRDNDSGESQGSGRGAANNMVLDKLGMSVPTREFYASGVSRQALSTALTAYQNYSSGQRNTQSTRLTLVDYTKSRREKRLWVLDLTTGQVLHKEFCAHGYGSAHQGNGDYASKFKRATVNGSGQSQLGLMKASGANGKTGASGRVNQANASRRAGDMDAYEDRISTQRFSSLERKANGKVEKDVIMHWSRSGKGNGTTYGTAEHGVYGNSAGCWALPEEGNGKVVDLIRSGDFIFNYYPSKWYFEESSKYLGGQWVKDSQGEEHRPELMNEGQHPTAG